MLHGNRTYLLQDDDGQILEGHSISAGLDYPGVGPEHSWLKDTGRVTYVSATDKEALDAFQLCTTLEGIIPALEPAHALAYVTKLAPTLPQGRPPRDEHVRPRRQGHLRRRRPSRHEASDRDLRTGPHRRMTKETRIDRRFAKLKRTAAPALVTFVTAGDPDLETSKKILLGLPQAGADLIELGMPFSDPMADGPAIQAASLRALKAGQTMRARSTWSLSSARRTRTRRSC